MTGKVDETSDYGKLLKKTKDITLLGSVESIIRWDMDTKMPPRAVHLRSQQLGLLSQIEHRMITSPEIGTLLSKIEKSESYHALDDLQKRNVHLVRKYYDENTKLPEELVVETAKQRAIAVDVWKKAKATKNFAVFEPELTKLLELRKKAANILMQVKNTQTPYDALIDIFERRMTAEAITKTFSKLREGLISILKMCSNAPRQPDTTFLNRKVPVNTQRKISSELAKFIGYDVESPKAGGRIDETEHPFTSGYYDDIRITTHYYENNMSSSMFSILHEIGHALYGQNLKREWMFQPVGSSCSHGFSESQSRFIENIVGRSHSFWKHFYPRLRKLTGNTFADISLNDFVWAINEVKPSKIRVEADEVTYCLHVIVRFEIERELIGGKIEVSDLPEIWNRKYKEYLGVDVQNDSEGVMQDIHWASGYFGYFPTYALGNIYSGQILGKMENALPDWKSQLAEGNCQNVKKWLAENVQSHGNLYDPPELIKKIVGRELDVKPYLDYLYKKYSQLY